MLTVLIQVMELCTLSEFLPQWLQMLVGLLSHHGVTKAHTLQQWRAKCFIGNASSQEVIFVIAFDNTVIQAFKNCYNRPSPAWTVNLK